MSKHRFILCGSVNSLGWWLCITSENELLEYHSNHSDMYGKALENIVKGKEFMSDSVEHGPHLKEMPLSQSIWFTSMNNGKSVIKSIIDISSSVFNEQVKAIEKYGKVYINRVGGWCWELLGEVKQFMDKRDLTFPDFDKNDIRVERFPNGKHYYAYIGGMQVRDGDVLKWNTYQEAYDTAYKVVNN